MTWTARTFSKIAKSLLASFEIGEPAVLNDRQFQKVSLTCMQKSETLCPPELKVRTSAHTKHPGWSLAFESPEAHRVYSPADSLARQVPRSILPFCTP